MKRRGVTLLEVIVASLILAVTVGGVLYVFSTEKGVVAHTGRRVQAMDFARQTLEDLKNEVSATTWPNTGLLAPGGPRDEALPDGTFKSTFVGTRNYTVQDIDINGGGADYKSVSVTVNWQEPAQP